MRAEKGSGALIAAPAAYGIVWRKPRGRNTLFAFTLMTQMLPAIVFVIPLFIVFTKINLVNTLPGLTLADMTFTIPFALIMLSAYMKDLPYELVEAALVADPAYAFPATIVANIWIGFPFNFILLYAGMRSIPVEVYQAAKIDGANFWKRVVHITLPLLKPVSAAVLMLGTIYTVKVFDLVFIMTGGGPANGTHLLSTYAYQVGFSLLNFGEAAAIATLMVLLVLLLNLMQMVLQRK